MRQERIIENSINLAVRKICKRYRLKFGVKIVKGEGASIHPKEIWLGKETIKNMGNKEIEALIIHEAFHLIYEDLDETEEFKEKDRRGNIIPYFKKEIKTWNRVKEKFPEYKDVVDKFIEKLHGYLNPKF